ncbi:hypothetical protein HDU91_001069 [Kappamyces sp. JEL0680]|nr:hypothetical protein HDU91_001069 [Kappamyces sp. JEL0680]
MNSIETLPLELVIETLKYCCFDDFLRLKWSCRSLSVYLGFRPQLFIAPFRESVMRHKTIASCLAPVALPFSLCPQKQAWEEELLLLLSANATGPPLEELFVYFPDYWLGLVSTRVQTDNLSPDEMNLAVSLFDQGLQAVLQFRPPLFRRVVETAPPRFFDSSTRDECLEMACSLGRAAEFCYLWDLDFDRPSSDTLTRCLLACLPNASDSILGLLLAKGADPTLENHRVVRAAASFGNQQAYISFLTNPIHPVAPSFADNLLIKECALKGMQHLASYLLEHHASDIDPACANNLPILKACTKGHLDVVLLLLLDHRVDPAAQSNKAIKLAAMNGYLGIVEVLLNDPRVDPSGDKNTPGIFAEFPLTLASKYGHVEVVRRLLADKRVDPRDDAGAALIQSSKNGHAEVVEVLLDLPGIRNDTNRVREARKWAHRMGRFAVIRLLEQWCQLA